MSLHILSRTAAAFTLLAVLWYFPLPAEPTIRLCAFHWLTGHPCPLCGLTRALFALAKGDWMRALQFNALSPLGFAMLFSLFWKGIWQARIWTFGIAAFAVYGVWRIALV